MAKSSTAERARRLIALLGRLRRGAKISLTELAEDLGVTTSEIATDLEMLSMCGLAPYDPSELVPIMVEDGYVEVFGDLPAVTSPIRLSQSEATALVSALQAVGYESGHPLTAKLLDASACSFSPEALGRVLRSSLDTHETSVYEILAQGVSAGRVVSLAHSQDEDSAATRREVEPYRLFAERGCWYATTWCRHADGWRTFRLDRIREARLTDETFAARDVSQIPEPTAVPGGDVPFARLAFAPAEKYVEREWPGSRVVQAEPDGNTIVDAPFAGTSWLARHVVARFGGVEVVSPAEMRDAVAELARTLR